MLKAESNTFTRRASSVAIDAPKIGAQFFYQSTQIIDDPLAAVPPPSRGSATNPSKVPPRPFSVHDNIALDQAWLKLPEIVQDHGQAQSRLKKDASQGDSHESELYAASIPPKSQNRDAIAKRIDQDEHKEKSSQNGKKIEIRDEANTRQAQTEHNPGEKLKGADITICDDSEHSPLQKTVPVTGDEIVQDEVESGLRKPNRSRSFFRRKEKEESHVEDLVSTRSSNRRLSRGRQGAGESAVDLGRSPDTTGTPFLRVASRLRRSSKSPDRGGVQKAQVDGADSPGKDYRPKQSSPLGVKPRYPSPESSQDSQDEDDLESELGLGGSHSLRRREDNLRQGKISRVTVGVARLHVVEMPSLKVSPSRVSEDRMEHILITETFSLDGTNLLGSCPR